MSDQPETAAILAFPERPDDRLRRALRSLQDALAAQRVAVAGFRRELGSLASAVRGLDGSLASYRDGLAGAEAAVAAARAESARLDATADALLAATAG